MDNQMTRMEFDERMNALNVEQRKCDSMDVALSLIKK